jgi:hypothetical protein
MRRRLGRCSRWRCTERPLRRRCPVRRRCWLRPCRSACHPAAASDDLPTAAGRLRGRLFALRAGDERCRRRNQDEQRRVPHAQPRGKFRGHRFAVDPLTRFVKPRDNPPRRRCPCRTRPGLRIRWAIGPGCASAQRAACQLLHERVRSICSAHLVQFVAVASQREPATRRARRKPWGKLAVGREGKRRSPTT